MEWMSISFSGVFLLGGLCLLLWQRHRAQRCVLTRHTVRCPSHDLSATLVVRTDLGTRRGRRYIDVTACSLLPEQPVEIPARRARVPDLVAYEVYCQRAEPSRRYSAHVPCRRHCLYILNGITNACHRHPLSCTSGTHDSSTLVQQVVANPGMACALWYHSV